MRVLESVVNHWVTESTPQRGAFSEMERKLEDCKMCTFNCEVLKLSDVKREYLTRSYGTTNSSALDRNQFLTANFSPWGYIK